MCRRNRKKQSRIICRRNCKKQSCIICKAVLPVFKKLLKIALSVYAVLFTIFYFNLDTKLFYRIMPILNKYHYDVMPAKDFAESIKGRNE